MLVLVQGKWVSFLGSTDAFLVIFRYTIVPYMLPKTISMTILFRCHSSCCYLLRINLKHCPSLFRIPGHLFKVAFEFIVLYWIILYSHYSWLTKNLFCEVLMYLYSLHSLRKGVPVLMLNLSLGSTSPFSLLEDCLIWFLLSVIWFKYLFSFL